MKATEIAISAICAALYGVVGYVIYLFLPITTPGIGIVRFWPNVVIPATFAVLFGPFVGGFGAAIGIFISDVLIHGDPLLSLCAGVPANFLGFYLIGYISRKKMDWTKLSVVSSIGCMIIALGSLVMVSYVSLPTVVETVAQAPTMVQNATTFRMVNQTAFNEFMKGVNPMVNGLNLFTAIMIAIFIVTMGIGYMWKEWRNYGVGSIIGLGVGSAIIGLVVWAYSQLFTLPVAVGGGFQLPFYASLAWFVWTFSTEIPFLILLGPPIIKVCYRAFPSLQAKKEEE